MLPLLADKFLESLEVLSNGVKMFREKCIVGIEVEEERCQELLDNSLGLLTALNPYLGYQLTSQIAEEVLKTDKTVQEAVLEREIFTENELEKVLSPEEMTQPGIPGKK
jgi:aspartate ammonia-lyase